LAFFTYRLYRATNGLLNHVPLIERAYLSGSGMSPGADYVSPFAWDVVFTIENSEKTPGSISKYAVVFREITEISGMPEYLKPGYLWTDFRSQIAPNGKTVLNFSFEEGPRNPVVYGRFYYMDIWQKERFFSFVLPLRHSNDHSSVARFDPEYTKWT
jgi:hypothetical protein